MKKLYYLLMATTIISILWSCEFNYTYEELWYDKYHFNDCSTDSCIEINGHVSSISGDGIADAVITFKEEERNMNNVIGTTQTDENGNYTIQFIPTDQYDFFIINIEKDDYLEKNLYFDYSPNFDSTSFHIFNYLLPTAPLNVQLRNTNPYNNKDQISTSFSYCNNIYKDYINISDYEIEFTCGSSSGEKADGRKVDIENTYFFPLGETINIYWKVTKNGVSTKYSDKIVIESGSNHYLIEY